MDNLTTAQKNKIKSDLIKNTVLKNKGWKVLRFFESDIKEDIEKIMEDIQEAITYNIKEVKKIKSPLDDLMSL